MTKRIFVFILLVYVPLSLTGQTISGKILGQEKFPIGLTNILIKNAETPDLISEFTTSKQDGSYSIQLKSDFENIIVEFTKFGYETQTYQFRRSKLGKEYRLDVELTESSVELQEVIIRQKPKIEVKEDTVNYLASAFLDGSERKVEDLLKKLPGIQVDDDGKIKYKGKNVEKVLLEGDDLFDYNYTVGTRNMNVGIVEQVQAIENFTENPLLRGIQDSDKVALNLKLKKNIIDFSGNGSFGYGIENRHYADLNALTITKSIKNFSTINYNNIGENRTPYDFFAFKPSLSDLQNQSLKAPKLLQERIYSSGLDNKRANLNDNWFGNFNNIYKFSNRLSARLNLSYYHDQLDFFSSNFSDFAFEDGTQLVTSREENLRKKPELYDASLKLTWNSSQNSLVEFTSNWNWEKINTTSNLFTNNQNDLFTQLNSESFFAKQELLFTQKLNERNVIQLKGIYSHNDLPQEFTLNPGLDFHTGEILNTIQNRQRSHFAKDHYELLGSYLGAKNKNKFQVDARLRYTQNQLESKLFENQELLGSDFENDLNYDVLEANVQSFYNFRFGKLTVRPTAQLKIFSFDRQEDFRSVDDQISRIALTPSLYLNYKINDVMRLFANYSYDESPLRENNLYNGYILNSSRSLSRNLVTNEFQKNHSAFLGFGIHDMYNQFTLNAGLNYSEQKNNFFAQTKVTENLTTIEYFFLPEGNRSYGAHLNTEKYLPFLQTTFRIGGNYSQMAYKNIVKNSDLRNNVSDFFGLNFYGKTAFDIPVNFQNELKLMHSQSKSQQIDQTFKNTLLTNSFKILVKPNRFWFGSISLDYFQPSTQNPNEYLFLDAMIRYQSPNRIWQFSLTGRNLTNNKFFEEIFVSDYYTSSSHQSLNRAFVLAEMSFNF